jgi:hypothetical protein
MSSKDAVDQGETEVVGSPLRHTVSVEAVATPSQEQEQPRNRVQGIDEERFKRFSPRRKRAILAVLSYTCFLARLFFSFSAEFQGST